jgi:DNA polymerase IV
MANARAATILHADLDAFYASVEQLLDPTLRARPIAVGQGVVLAASYEARSCGVSAGMPGWRARQLCPDLTFVPGHFREYQRLGDEVIEILGAFTPVVERISIDEAFLDVAGARNLFGPPPAIAAAIRRRVRGEIGLALSVGVARTKHLAKVASQVAKPDGLVVVAPEGERQFLECLPVELIWGVGPVTRAHLANAGIHTIGELAVTSSSFLDQLFGRALGGKLAALATNVDPRTINPTRRATSVGAQAALGRRAATPEVLRSTLAYLADRVAGRLRAAGQAARTVTVRVRFIGLRSVTRSATVTASVSATLTLAELATDLANTALAENPAEREITLLAISASNLVQPALQLELPFDVAGLIRTGTARPGTTGAGTARTATASTATARTGTARTGTTKIGTAVGVAGTRCLPSSAVDAARWALDSSVDAIRARFGRESVGYATIVFSDLDRVPEAFRELAEHQLSPPAAGER